MKKGNAGAHQHPANGFRVLETDVEDLHSIWLSYKELYGNDEKIALLTSTAPGFFALVQKVLFDELVIRIARLLDAPKTKHQENLTLRSLPEKLRHVGNSDLASEIEKLLSQLKAAAGGIIQRRHKRGTHRDRDYVLGTKAIPPVPGRSVDDVLEKIRSIMNMVGEHLGADPKPILYEHVKLGGDAGALLSALRSAIEHRSCRQRRR